MLAGLLWALVGALLSFSIVKWDERRRARKTKRKVRELLLSVVVRADPASFVSPTCSWSKDAENRSIGSRTELDLALSEFLRSESKLLLLTGAYAMGKTFMARALAGRIAKERQRFGNGTPLVIHSDRINTDSILSEMSRQISEDIAVQFDETELRALIHEPGCFLVFDALDQLPYKAGEKNRLDVILDLVDRLTADARFAGKIVLVVRDEFLGCTSQFDPLTASQSVPRLRVQGFPSLSQIRQFLEGQTNARPCPHWSRLEALIAHDATLIEVFSRPVTLARFAAISTGRLTALATTGTTVAEVFQLSFAALRDAQRASFEELALAMFRADRFFVHLRSAQLSAGLPSVESARTLAAETGLLAVDQYLCRFLHASWRDFFVAQKFIRSIVSGQPEALGWRQNNYLISEFVAGLLDRNLLVELLSLCTEISSAVLRLNAIDILGELEKEDLKGMAREYFTTEIAAVSARNMDDLKISLYTNAGILGFSAMIDEVIAHVRTVGIAAFLRDYSLTKDTFAYYDHSQERCEAEWINAVERKKYRETRRLIAFLLGEMRSVRALPTLRAVKDNSAELLTLREAAASAVRRIVGEKGGLTSPQTD